MSPEVGKAAEVVYLLAIVCLGEARREKSDFVIWINFHLTDNRKSDSGSVISLV